jgi:hypothetical protein
MLLAGRHRTWLTGTAVAAATAVLLVGFFVSPLLLLLIDRWISVDWSRLSEISPAYDAASAFLAGLAVAGVAVSLVMQVRQIRISQVQAARLMHLELMRMLTADPALRATSPAAVAVTPEEWRRSIYTNLFFKYLEMGFEIGHISEEALRQHFAAHFRLAHARDFWRRTAETFRVDADRRATRRFFQIVDEEYRSAAGGPAPATGMVDATQAPAPSRWQRQILVIGVSLLAGVAIGVTRSRQRRQH